MRISVDEGGEIVIKEVFSGIGLETSSGEEFGICMRDSGFEFKYAGVWYAAKEGKLGPL